jgi:hypothetical protein
MREELEGDGSAKPEILGLVDHSHPALAELGQNPVVGHPLGDFQATLRPSIS